MRKLLIIMLFLFHLPLIAAHFHENNCCNQRYFILGFPEALWIDVSPIIWRNCRNDYVYAMTADYRRTNNETNTFHILEPTYHGGIRVGAGYSCNDCISYFAEYTYYSSYDKDTTDVPLFVPFFIFPSLDTLQSNLSTITLEVRNRYQRVRALGSIYLMNSCCFNFYVFGGLGWLNLKEFDEENGKTLPRGQTPVLPVFLKQDMIFNGGTIECGFGMKYYFYNRFGVSASLNGVAAIGERSYIFRYTQINSDNTNDIRNRLRDLVVCVPGFDLRLELLYSTCFCYFPMTFALGYEQHHFFNILLGNPLFLPFSFTESGVIQTHPSQLQTPFDVGYSGPYVAIRFNY